MEKLSDLDTFFLAGETSAQHLHVLATMVLDHSDVPGGWDYTTFRSRVSERFRLIDPLRRRLQHSPLARPMWVDDEDFHLDRHLHHIVLPDGGGLAALSSVAAEIASFPLPKDRPLWEAWFVEGMGKEDVAVIAKIHHCAVDGVSGIYALAEFFDLEPFPEPGPPTPPPESAARPKTVEVGRATVGELMRRPESVARSAWHLGQSALAMVSGRSMLAPLPFSGPRQPYNRSLTQHRSVAFTTIQLEDIKKIRTNLGASVNDVLVALCAGILRDYAIANGETPARPLVAGVPVSERTPEHGSTGNRISFMFYSLPVHCADPAARLEEVTKSAKATKDLYEKTGPGLLGSIAALTPKSIISPFMRIVSGLHVANHAPPIANVTISNIRGPELPLYVAGARLRTLFPMGPLIEGVGLGITLLSHDDEVAIGFLGCDDYIPDIERLAQGTHIEVERMLEAVGAGV